MKGWMAAVALAMLCLPPARLSAASDEATLLRVFLQDGTSFVSYGEFARVADRVVFSMPTAATSNPPLQLVNIPADRVDWDRTNRYADSARAARYVAIQAENDYAVLSNGVVRALDQVVFTTDVARRLAIVENARKTLAEWPQTHFNYRLGEVRQMLLLLDEAIADLRVTAGGERFDLSLVALAEPPGRPEPLLPPPTPVEAIEQLLSAARLTGSAAERQVLLNVVIVGLDRDAAALPAEWAAARRAETSATIDRELRIDRSYQAMMRRMIGQAEARARLADVHGVTLVLDRIHRDDAALGEKRPDAVREVIAAVLVQLDAARRLRLARDHWALRAPALRQYGDAIGATLGVFRSLQQPLEDIKTLAGSAQAALAVVHRQVEHAVRLAGRIVPPEECRAAHALLVSAAQLADTAARIRHEATVSGDIARAWDASSAAAGALMLSARAQTEIRALLRPPRLP